MIIELYGLPASGKTTVARTIETRFAIPRIQIKSRRELLYRNGLFFFRHPINFFFGFIRVCRHARGLQSGYYKFMNAFLHTNAVWQKAAAGQGIVDQGFFQQIISVFESPISERTMRRMIRHFPKPDILVVFNINKDEREKRLRARGHRPRADFEKSDRKRWEAAAEKNDTLFQDLLDSFTMNTIVIQKSNDLDRLFEKMSLYVRH